MKSSIYWRERQTDGIRDRSLHCSNRAHQSQLICQKLLARLWSQTQPTGETGHRVPERTFWLLLASSNTIQLVESRRMLMWTRPVAVITFMGLGGGGCCRDVSAWLSQYKAAAKWRNDFVHFHNKPLWLLSRKLVCREYLQLLKGRRWEKAKRCDREETKENGRTSLDETFKTTVKNTKTT